MATPVNELVFACNWPTQSNYEHGGTVHYEGNVPVEVVVATPSPPATPVNGGGRCLEVDSTFGGIDSGLIQITRQDALADIQDGSMSALLRPKTNPGALLPILFGPDTGSLGGFIPALNTSKQLLLTSYLGVTLAGPSTTVIDAASPDWYLIEHRWSVPNRSLDFRIFKYNSGAWDLLETVSAYDKQFGSTNYLRWGRPYGSASGAYYMTNFSMWAGGGWPPWLPNFEWLMPNVVSTNHASWVKGDTGTDDAANEPGYVNEVPPSDVSTSYVKITAVDNTAAVIQYYRNAGFPTGKNILGVGGVARCYGQTLNAAARVRLKHGANLFYGQQLIPEAAKYFYAQVFSSVIPPARTTAVRPVETDRWDDTDLNTTCEWGHSIADSAGQERRVSQVGMYMLHGADEYEISRRGIGRAQVIGG